MTQEWTATVSEVFTVSRRPDQDKLNALWVRAFQVVERDPAPADEAVADG